MIFWIIVLLLVFPANSTIAPHTQFSLIQYALLVLSVLLVPLTIYISSKGGKSFKEASLLGKLCIAYPFIMICGGPIMASPGDLDP